MIGVTPPSTSEETAHDGLVAGIVLLIESQTRETRREIMDKLIWG